jgi:hypothetical protein
MFSSVFQDVRYACRWLMRSPGFTAIAILSLGIGVGFNTAIFAVADTLLLRPLPVVDPGRLVDIYTSGSDGDTYSSSSLPDLQDFGAQSVVFDDVFGYTPMFAAVAQGDRARLVLGEVVTANYFTVLGVRAGLGRTLLATDDAVGGAGDRARTDSGSGSGGRRGSSASAGVRGQPCNRRRRRRVVTGLCRAVAQAPGAGAR